MKKKSRPETNFILFDVVYQDGTRTSYRKVPATQVDELDSIKAAKAFIEDQDRKVAALSGAYRGPIKVVLRSTRQ